MSPQVKLASWILFLIILLLISSKFIQGPFTSGKGSVLGITFPAVSLFNLTSSFSFAFQSSKLSRIIQENLTGQEGEYAVYIEDLSDEESYGFNQFEIFPAASLYKLYLMAAVLKEVELSAPIKSGSANSLQSSDNNVVMNPSSSVIPAKAGIQLAESGNDNSDGLLEITLDTKISASKKHLTEVLGELDFGYEESPEQITYTVEEALQRVGRISDNFASIMLAEKIGWDKAQIMADSLGSQNTVIKSPIRTSAADIGLFFKKLYKKQVVSEAVSDKIIEYLSLSKIEDRIPAGLPEGGKTVHKTGELSRIRHDAGIVYLPDSQGVSLRGYVIVLLSKELKYEDDGVELLAKISKDVYEYFKLKSPQNK